MILKSEHIVRVKIVSTILRIYISILCIVFLILSKQLAASTNIPHKFQHISIENGLSNNSVVCAIQDSYGFIWFGTSNGLNRFDGHSFKTFKYQPDNNNSLSSNVINALLEDANGNIWIGTDRGLTRFNTKTGRFKRFLFSENESNSISNNIGTLLEDKNGNIWIGSNGNGVYRILPTQKLNNNIEFEHYSFDSAKNNNVYTLFSHIQNQVWLGTESNLILLYKEKNETTYRSHFFPLINAENNSIRNISKGIDNSLLISTFEYGLFEFTYSEDFLDAVQSKKSYKINKIENNKTNLINCTFLDAEENLWVATRGAGILYYPNFRTNKTEFSNLIQKSEDLNSISGNYINSFLEDNSGVIWVLIESDGVCKYIPNKKPFKFLGLENSFSDQLKYIATVEELDENNLIIGTRDNGILKYQLQNATGQQENLTRLNWFEDKTVRKVLKDSHNNLWMATGNTGIKVFNRQGELINHFYYVKDSNSISHNYIFEILEDSKGLFWIGSWGGSWGGGLDMYDPKSGKFTNFSYDANDETSLSWNIVLYIEEDAKGQIWVGTKNGGLNLLQKNSKGYYFKRFKHSPKNSRSLNDDHVTYIHKSTDNSLWISTESGLNKYNYSSQDFENTTLNKELNNQHIVDITEDKNGVLWLATYKGITKYNPLTNDVKSFDNSDGIRSGFRAGMMQSTSKDLFFYGKNGIVRFNPEKIEINKRKPTVKISDILIYNLDSAKSENKFLNLTIPSKDEITLKYSENNFSISFAALSFIKPEKNKYAYRMEGYNQTDNWNYPPPNQRTVNYSNLREGKYVFTVKASNNDGIWNEEGKSLQIIIRPPYYRTFLAYVFYFVLISFLVVLFVRLVIKREEQKIKIKLEQLERKKIEELNKIRLSFFTNISHEFKTPLTLITAPVEKLLTAKNLNEEKRNNLYIGIHKNADRLLRLINELMDFRKLESGKLELKPEQTELVEFLKNICQNFNEIANEQGINFEFLSSHKALNAKIDRGKIEKVIFNLLSNAFKYTPSGGYIEVHLKPIYQNHIFIEVTDSGKGIPQNEIEKIFERFHQAENNTGYDLGTGIGLNLAKSFIEMHNGIIKVESIPNQKTTFTIQIPTNVNTHQEESVVELNVPITTKFEGKYQTIAHKSDFTDGDSTKKDDLPCILIVDDSKEIRTFLKNEFSESYRIIEAVNGKDGLSKALKANPELIISDIMMPEMNGFDFCKNIKTNIHTSHIPVILLTAKSAQENIIEGLETGADAYISKPFKLEHLEVRIRKLLESRQKLRKLYSRSLIPEPKKIATNETDEKFLQKAIKYVEEKLDDQDLNIEMLCKELGMSKTSVNAKLKAITGKSTGGFIRSIRLKNAVRLLESGNMNVSEVCYSVGFNTMWYFSKCFKNEYNALPSDFIKKE